MSLHDAYDPNTRWGRAFGVVDKTVYSPPLYQHRGQDIRKLNDAGTGSVATQVLSLSAGKITHQYAAAATGREIVVDTGRERGRYEIHCHSAWFPGVGVTLDAGSVVTENATAAQQPGTGWDGPHDHFVISDYPDAAHTPSRPVYDPRPFILSALATVAGDTGRPFTPQPKEDDMTRLIKFDTGTLPNDPTFLIAPGFLYCHADAEEQRVDRYLYDTTIKSLSAADFYRTLKTHGLHGAAGTWGSDPSAWSLPKPGVAYLEAPGSKG